MRGFPEFRFCEGMMSLTVLTLFALALLVAAGSPDSTGPALVSRVLMNGFRKVMLVLATMAAAER